MAHPSIFQNASQYSQLYPRLMDTFRVAIIPPRREFHFYQLFSYYEIYYSIGFLVYILFNYVVRKLFFKEPNAPNCLSIAVEVLQEIAGQAALTRYRYASVNIVRGFWYFFIFTYSITTTGRMVAILTDTVYAKEYSTLDSVKES